MGRPGPNLAKIPVRQQSTTEKNPEARKKHNETNKKINDTEAKRTYRRNLMRIRRKRKVSPHVDLSHQPDGSVKPESRKQTVEEAEQADVNL